MLPDIDEVGESEAPSDDLRSLIESAVADADTPATPPPGKSQEPAEADVAKTGERARGPDGKFVAKSETEGDAPPPKTAAEPKTVAPPKGVAPDGAAPPTTPQPSPSDPTARWSAGDKEMYKSLPPAAQEFITRRYKEMEGDYTQKTQAIAEFRRTYDPVDKMFEPFKAQMKQQGWTEASLVKAWADVEHDLMTGKGAQRVADMIRLYRLPIDEVLRASGYNLPGPQQGSGGAQQSSSDPNAPQLDPVVVPLLEQQFGKFAQPLIDQLMQLTSAEQNRQQMYQRVEQQRFADEQRGALDQVQGFVDEKAEDGSPLHPYFNDVSGHMVALAKAEREQGRKPDLHAIYEQAVWAHPQTREKLLEDQRSSQADKTRKESVAKAASARKAASSVTGAPGSGHAASKAPSSKSLRDLIADAADEVLES